MVRVQCGLEAVSRLHAVVRELLKEEAAAAKSILQLAMCAAPGMAARGPARALEARERMEAEGEGGVSSFRLREDFDLGAALDATQQNVPGRREGGRRSGEGRGQELPRGVVQEPCRSAAGSEEGAAQEDDEALASAEEGSVGDDEADVGTGLLRGSEGAGPKKHPLSTPRLLRMLMEEVSHMALGDGVTIACCNKEDAGRGVIARTGMRVTAELRRKARKAEREAKQAVKDAEEAMKRREMKRQILLALEPGVAGGKGEKGGVAAGKLALAAQKSRGSEELSVASVEGSEGTEGGAAGGSMTISATAST
eukprot:3387014-Rhodomonas_salina.1